MSIDPLTDELISLAQASRQMHRYRPGTTAPHVATLHRWARRGLKGVRLEAKRLGSRWYTTPDALRLFFDRCTEAGLPEEPVIGNPSLPSNRQGKQEADDGRQNTIEEHLRQRFRM